MPRLILFAPCQKAILDRNDLSVSLISVLGGLTFNPIGNARPDDVPADAIAVAPIQWGAVSVWLRLPTDGDRMFEQRVELILPDGRTFGGSDLQFRMTERTHNIAVAANLFPIGAAGEYRFALSLREVGPDQEWTVISEYPVLLQFVEQNPE